MVGDQIIVHLKKGDVNKLAVRVFPDGTMTIKVYDGTSGDKDDLLIQAFLNREEVKKLRFAINNWPFND